MKNQMLIVSDTPFHLRVIESLLKLDCKLLAANGEKECIQMLERFTPALIIIDIEASSFSGLELCRRIKSGRYGDRTQVILLSAESSPTARLHGYEAGADDFVLKPFVPEELLRKISLQFRVADTLSKLTQATLRLEELNERLTPEGTSEIQGAVRSRDTALLALAKLAESRDMSAGNHLERVQKYCRALAESLAVSSPYADQFDTHYIDDLVDASVLHDIGKIAIPDVVLLKQAGLSPEDFEQMKRHCQIGAEALEEEIARKGPDPFLNMSVEIARSHHESFNGTGYPDGLEGEAIPLPARIVALIDTFDGLTSPRVYKREAKSPEEAKEIILDERGKRFDPVVVDAFIACFDRFAEIQAESFTEADMAEEELTVY